MNICKRLNWKYQDAKAARRRLRARPRREQELHKQFLLGSGTPKPPQPSIIRLTTARALAYLERHGLINMRGSDIIVSVKGPAGVGV